MTDYRYWITYEGRVSAETEEQARTDALADHESVVPIVDLEAEGEE